MKKLTRDQELKMIEETKKLLHDGTARDQLARWYETCVSDAAKLALTGASWQAIGEMPDSAKGGLGRHIDLDVTALFMAANIRCLTTYCEHVADVSIVRHVFLAPRVVCCKGCIGKFYDLFKAHDAKREKADECDLCLANGLVTFYKFQIAFNGAMFHGDFCAECRQVTTEVAGGKS